MFGITIFACYAFKIILSRLNQKLERGELEWDARDDVANQTAEMEGTTVDEALSMRVSCCPCINRLVICTILIHHTEGIPLFGVVKRRILPKLRRRQSSTQLQQSARSKSLNSWMGGEVDYFCRQFLTPYLGKGVYLAPLGLIARSREPKCCYALFTCQVSEQVMTVIAASKASGTC